MRKSDYLFRGVESHQAVAQWQRGLKDEIDSQPADYILNLSEADYLRYIIDKYTIDALVLHIDRKHVEVGDAQIDIAGRFDYAVDREEGPAYVKGTTIDVSIPFEGDPKLLNLTLPSTYYQSPKEKKQKKSRRFPNRKKSRKKAKKSRHFPNHSGKCL